ncbi:MAG TPA: lysophospholipid acyltransferase family protein [Micropepsaceae bacterium]|nr:lysophospholipid acyltransferase family protein [Micropepsaceae bacterium]
MILFLRSTLFLLWFGAVSVLMNVGLLPLLLLPRRATFIAAHIWSRLVLFGLRWIAGTGVEVRGRLSEPRVLVASKHFSMWETMAFLSLLPRPAIVLKQSLLNIPLYGWYCRKMQMIAIDRSAGAKAIRVMGAAAKHALDEDRPVVIFPEGTRKNPGARPDYKPGVAALYSLLSAPCVPVAHNSGLYWNGFWKRPGTIVVEFLDPIPPGLSRQAFMIELEQRIEAATNRLLEEGNTSAHSREGIGMDYKRPI